MNDCTDRACWASDVRHYHHSTAAGEPDPDRIAVMPSPPAWSPEPPPGGYTAEDF